MDVRISHSVNLDKVPDKVADMLNDIHLHKASHLIELAMHMIELGHHEVGLTFIDNSRKMLSDIDRCLSESHMILGGYINANNTTPADAPAPPVEPGDADVD